MITYQPRPLRQPFFAGGTYALLAFMAVGYAFGLARFLVGLDGVTNLSNHYPWGIWKALNVAAGVALAACGFTAAALIDIFGRHRYHALLRPAIVTAWLGYLMVAVALVFDLGRYWGIWQPLIHWQGNSVLFEVAMCVVAYLVVLTFEMSPALLEGLQERIGIDGRSGRTLLRLRPLILNLHRWVKLVLPLFIVAGFVLSCMHHSSLGTLMLIARTKLDPFWLTPLLPVLFLLSAMMVGFPMIIMESLLAAREHRYRPDMETLGSLARAVPWFIILYLLVKLGDLIARHGELSFVRHPELTVSLAVEIVAGLIIPCGMLLSRTLRRSPRYLLAACLLIIGGVVLNRLNAYLIGYYPPFAAQRYFPSVGEISLTVAIACTIILGFRLFANYLPVLSVPASITSASQPAGRPSTRETRRLAWTLRTVAVALLLGFVFLYATVHRQALAGYRPFFKGSPYALVDQNVSWEWTAPSHAFRPGEYRNFYLLENAALNYPTNYYQPALFSHRSHDTVTGGDCGVCHHRVSLEEGDRRGEDLHELHLSFDIRLGGPCSSCHEDLSNTTFQACSDCHRRPNDGDGSPRVGLKGAYHQQCMGCHADQPRQILAPMDCRSCHRPRVPDHAAFVSLPRFPSVEQVTSACLQCHRQAAEEVLGSAHWRWRGLSSSVIDHEHSADLGLLGVLDSYAISADPDLVPSERFHIGSGSASINLRHPEAGHVDCLVCHDSMALHRRNAANAGDPAGLDLSLLAARVKEPTRANCGGCHFYMGGGSNVKHGDLEPALVDPSPELDVHMGLVGLQCQDCHRTRGHRIAGLSFHAPITEGRAQCRQCHGDRPHAIVAQLGRHLDKHIETVACETCHIPFFARGQPTQLGRDYSTAGRDLPDTLQPFGLPAYDKRFGDLEWGRDVVPQYRWFDGTRDVYLLGEKIRPGRLIELNAPSGQRADPASLIFPYKVYTATQPYDSEKRILLPVKFADGYWEHFDWDRAIADGCRTAGLDYSGQFGFVQTRMYTSIHHEVPPAARALGCGDCHDAQAVRCGRCHSGMSGSPLPQRVVALYPDTSPRLDFPELGYAGDPASRGGRSRAGPGPGRPAR
jgi:octaheme c-type cytochrome (tetrathionate reductase family)